MRCARCGANNPPNSKKCMYCGADLSVLKHNAKAKTTTDKVIIGVIIALVSILLLLGGIYAYENMSSKGGFSSGGGGGGIPSSSQPSQPNNEINVTLDGKDPDVEIYSFNTDTYEILVGTTKAVKFTAEIFVNIKLDEDDVTVVNESGAVLGYMNDKGEKGDAVAEDGIYTLVSELSSDARSSAVYTATAKGVVSNPIEILFYTEVTAEDHNNCKTTLAKVSELNDAEQIKQYLTDNPDVENVAVSSDNDIVMYKMKSGITCVWEKNVESDGENQVKQLGNNLFEVEPFLDYSPIRTQVSQADLNRVNADGDVCVIRPFRNRGYSLLCSFGYDDFLDAGNILANALDGRCTNFDDSSATIDVFKSFDDYGVILVDSHGVLSNATNAAWTVLDTDPYMLTGTDYGRWQSFTSADWQSERIIVCSGEGLFGGFIGGGVVGVGPKFFDRYYADNSLDGSIFYLGTCYSMRNDTLADALIRKGAEVVYGFSEPVTTTFCNEHLQELFLNQLTLGMTNARTGFSNSVQKYGRFDPYTNYNCEFRMKGRDSFVLVTDKGEGTVSGVVKSAENGAPISGALVRIYKDGTLVDSLRTDASGQYSINLLEDDYVIKISYGQYKTAKVAAEVTEAVTTYVETLLLLDAGLTSGYANGTITDATTGETVAGVSIKLRNSWNNRTGGVVTSTSTNGNGYYEVSYQPGLYTMEYSKDGYITGYKNIVIGYEDFMAQNAAISPELPDDGNFRIVLSWSNMPDDLDSHLTGPTTEGDRFHLYYKYANSNGGSDNPDYYQLDLDNTDISANPNTPETVTIVTQVDGVYRYSVHDFSNRGSSSSEAMSQSNATVNVYKGSVLVATYHVPPNVRGSIWTVFELSGNEIKPINTISSGYEDDISKF